MILKCPLISSSLGLILALSFQTTVFLLPNKRACSQYKITLAHNEAFYSNLLTHLCPLLKFSPIMLNSSMIY